MSSEITVLTFDCYGTLIDWERGILATDYSVKNKTEKNMPSTFQFLFQTSDGHASNAAQAFRCGTCTCRYLDTSQCRHDELRCDLRIHPLADLPRSSGFRNPALKTKQHCSARHVGYHRHFRV